MARLLSGLLLMAASLLPQEAPLFTRDFSPGEFATRRGRVYDAIGGQAIAVLQGAPSPDGYVRFRQSNEFYYLSGVEVPHAYLLLDGAQRKATLFLPNRNAGRESSEGRLLSADEGNDAKSLTGVDTVMPVSLLAEHLTRSLRTVRTLYTPFMPAEGASVSRDLALRAVADIASDPWDGRPSREGRFLQLLRERFPQFELKDLTPTIDRLRLTKSPQEITLLRKATKLSGLALLEGMRSTKPGITEFELDGMAKFLYYRNGAQGEAYYSLIASGRNAWYPHYNAGKRTMDGGDFLLMDFAPDTGYYMADVTRMWPVNGRFSDWQRELYGFYLSCYEAILQAIRPHVSVKQIKQEAVSKMRQALASAKFSKSIYQKAAEAFITEYESSPRPSLGHWVGMSTHDVGGEVDELRPGMVFTIEPALKVPEEKIYVRLEDMILVTESRAEVLSDFVPRQMEAIEKVMREPGLLQRYPKTE